MTNLRKKKRRICWRTLKITSRKLRFSLLLVNFQLRFWAVKSKMMEKSVQMQAHSAIAAPVSMHLDGARMLSFKVVNMDELAACFNLRTEEAVDRLNYMLESDRLTGVTDDRGKFIYITPEELHAGRFLLNMACFILLTFLKWTLYTEEHVWTACFPCSEMQHSPKPIFLVGNRIFRQQYTKNIIGCLSSISNRRSATYDFTCLNSHCQNIPVRFLNHNL